MILTAISFRGARIGEKKIFYELDVHAMSILKVGIKRFWAQEAKMSLQKNTCSLPICLSSR